MQAVIVSKAIDLSWVSIGVQRVLWSFNAGLKGKQRTSMLA